MKILFLFIIGLCYSSQWAFTQSVAALEDSVAVLFDAHVRDLGDEEKFLRLQDFTERAYREGSRAGILGKAYYQLGRYRYLETRFEDALEYGNRAERILQNSINHRYHAAWAYAMQGMIYITQNGSEIGYRKLGEAIRIADDPVPEGEAEFQFEPALFRLYQSRAASAINRFDEASLLLKVATQIYKNYQEPLRTIMYIQALITESVNANSSGDFERELSAARNIIREAQRIGDPRYEHSGHVISLSALKDMINHDSIDWHIAEIARLKPLISDENQAVLNQYDGMSYFARLVLDADEGRYDRLDSLLAGGVASFDRPEFDNEYSLIQLYTAAGRAYQKADRRTDAETAFDAAARLIFADRPLRGALRLPEFYGARSSAMGYALKLLDAKRTFYLSAGTRSDSLLAAAIDLRVDTLVSGQEHEIGGGYTEETFRRQSAEYYDAAIALCLKLHAGEGGDRYLRQALIYVERQKGRLLKTFISEPGFAQRFRVLEEVRDSVQNLQFRITRNNNSLAADAQNPDSLRAVTVRLYTELAALNSRNAARYPEYVRSVRQLPDPDLANHLPPANTYLIDYYYGKEIFLAFIVGPQGQLRAVSLPNPGDLNDVARATLQDTLVANQLFEQLLSPVLADIPPGAALQIVPHGELWNVPFAALRRSGSYLIETHPLSYGYSLVNLLEGNNRNNSSKEQQFVGFGISYGSPVVLNEPPVQDRNSKRMGAAGYLRYATDEVSEVASRLDGKFWLNEEVTTAKFWAAAEETEVLHLAMHGIQDDNPLASGLLFHSDSVPGDYTLLTMGEVLLSQVPAELVVLSACHSGYGPLEINEGAQSIARAFTFAGARSTLASNWEANDEITYRIVTRFYERLAAGEAKNVALQSAIVDFLSEASPAERDPRNWANLVLTGEVRPLPSRQASYWPWLLGALILAGAGAWAYAKRPA